jgi:putative acetyltransferase
VTTGADMQVSDLNMSSGSEGREQELAALFADAFTASEGRDEGVLIGGLVRDLLAGTPENDIFVFRAERGGSVIGAAIFTRLVFSQDAHVVFLLSPLAVRSEHQRQGVGQALLTHALEALRQDDVQIAMTYGDPDYYGRVGFKPVTQQQVRAPMPLSHPHGWIGQSLSGGPMPALQGPSQCVPALRRRDLW